MKEKKSLGVVLQISKELGKNFEIEKKEKKVNEEEEEWRKKTGHGFHGKSNSPKLDDFENQHCQSKKDIARIIGQFKLLKMMEN